MATVETLRLAGAVAMFGAAACAIGDLLLLAPGLGPVLPKSAIRIDFATAPGWRKRAVLLRAMSVMPPRRIMWGGLLGVFAIPLMLAGFWQVYAGLRPAGVWYGLPPTALWFYVTAVGTFVHGSFISLAAGVRALNEVHEDDRPVLWAALSHLQRVFQIAYATMFAGSIAAALWYALAAGSGRTLFPRWMAAVNPVTLTLAWLAIKRVLPRRVQEVTQGAGFNLANLLFFACTLWTMRDA